MSIRITGTISINCCYDDTDDWTWNLTEIDPGKKFGRAPKAWKPEWDSADTGAPMEQKYSYADFEYEGSLPLGLIKYLVMPEQSETSLDDVQVLITQPSSEEISLLKSKYKAFPSLNGNEVLSATLSFADNQIMETLKVLSEGKEIFSESCQTTVDKHSLFDPENTLFISDD